MDDSSEDGINMTDSMTYSLEKVKSIDISVDIPHDKLDDVSRIIERLDIIGAAISMAAKELITIKLELHALNLKQ